jgi:hypothetical protein
MLPQLRASLGRLQEARQVVLSSGERIRKWAVRDGGGREGAGYWEALTVLRTETERLSREGIILRDVESGLVDFPAERDGQPIFLCWRLGEDDIGYWHPPDTGFSGRRPL